MCTASILYNPPSLHLSSSHLKSKCTCAFICVHAHASAHVCMWFGAVPTEGWELAVRGVEVGVCKKRLRKWSVQKGFCTGACRMTFSTDGNWRGCHWISFWGAREGEKVTNVGLQSMLEPPSIAEFYINYGGVQFLVPHTYARKYSAKRSVKWRWMRYESCGASPVDSDKMMFAHKPIRDHRHTHAHCRSTTQKHMVTHQTHRHICTPHTNKHTHNKDTSHYTHVHTNSTQMCAYKHTRVHTPYWHYTYMYIHTPDRHYTDVHINTCTHTIKTLYKDLLIHTYKLAHPTISSPGRSRK